jgi:iron complex transport system ATP-binding protein
VAEDTGLALRSVTAGYGGEPVLRDVDLRVRPGEVVGLVGPNGSGKTTVVRVASRALAPTAGNVSLAGGDPYAVGARAAARLTAVVPQDVTIAFPFTVLETVFMGRTPYLSSWGGGGAEDYAIAREAMIAAQVTHLADREVADLSGGERRRVLLAQALAQDAPVLLLDEPTTHLDLRHVVDLLGIVRDLAERRGRAVLAVLHDLTVAAQVCDRIVVLQAGRVVADDVPAAVITSALLEGVYGVRGEIDVDPTTGRPAVRVAAAPRARAPLGRRVHVVGGAGRAAPLLRDLAALGCQVTVGVLHAGDDDAVVAERLNLERVVVPAFATIDDASAAATSALMTAAEVVVVLDPPIGPGNLENLRLAAEAAAAGRTVILVETSPIGERDFAAGAATVAWEDLRARARAVVADAAAASSLAGSMGP